MGDQSKIISLKDYSPICTESFEEVIGHEVKLPEDTGYEDLVNILGDETKQGEIHIIPEDKERKEIRLVSKFANGWWTQQYVGILQYDDKTIYIGSRFDDDNYFFTGYVLSKALGMNASLFKDMHPSLGRERVLQMLLAIVFVDQIKLAQKHGLFRMYRNYERNDAKVRGKIDVMRHINLNPLFNGKVAYSYREYTADNDINRVIYTAFTMLEKEYKPLMNGLLNKNRSVKDCMMQMGNIVSPASRQEVKGLLKQKNMKIHHSIYKDWENVRKTAVMILRHMGVNVAKSGKNEINGVLIDMTTIWEQYLESIFRNMSALDLELTPQKEFGAIYSEDENSRRTFKPDFCWSRKKQSTATRESVEEEIVFVADAKYKSGWSKVAEQELKRQSKSASKLQWDSKEREDVFQVFAYMFALKCSHGAIVCPVRGDGTDDRKDDSYKYYISEFRKEDFFYLFPLCIPKTSGSSYRDFKMGMENSEESLRKIIEGYVQEAISFSTEDRG